MLNVLIAVTMTLALFALAVSAIVEAGASATQLRARTLRRALKDLLAETDPPKGRTGAPGPLYRALYEGSHVGGIRREDLPSYIAPQEFAKALSTMLRKAADGSYRADAAETIKALPPGRLKDTLAALAADAGADMEKLKGNIECWFDTAMMRLSGEYKRMSQVLSFTVAFALAGALNADAVRMVQVLAASPLVAEQIASQAQGVLDLKPAPAADAAEGTTPETVEAQVAAAGQAVARAEASPLIGYACPDKDDRFCPEAIPPARWPLTLAGWLLMAITALAGAPFWFDVLQRFVNLRGTGPKPGTRTPGDGK
jgi:hypothetical protein